MKRRESARPGEPEQVDVFIVTEGKEEHDAVLEVNTARTLERRAPDARSLLQRLTGVGFVIELASVYNTQDAAHAVLHRAGIPVYRLRPFHATAPDLFWLETCQRLDAGLVIAGLEKLIAAASAEYPGNHVFKAGVDAARA